MRCELWPILLIMCFVTNGLLDLGRVVMASHFWSPSHLVGSCQRLLHQDSRCISSGAHISFRLLLPRDQLCKSVETCACRLELPCMPLHLSGARAFHNVAIILQLRPVIDVRTNSLHSIATVLISYFPRLDGHYSHSSGVGALQLLLDFLRVWLHVPQILCYPPLATWAELFP
jgi:hypothetical protein